MKRGEKGAPVVFYKQFEVESDNGDEDPQKRIFARHSIVFNVEQVEGFDIPAAMEAPWGVIGRVKTLRAMRDAIETALMEQGGKSAARASIMLDDSDG